MEPTDLTIEILKGIREESRRTNQQLDRTNEQLDELRTEVRTGLGELRDRQTATEVRLATELIGVAGAVREVRDLLREDRALRGRVDDHERRIAAIEERTG
jgi:predicted  nucleic acid-binding Zn-ribbon protein